MLGVDDAALALIAAGVIGTAGSLYANKKNLQMQQAVNDLALAQADNNNALQISLANTAHQREVRDLRAAGLNPILSAGGSGSAVPSLQQARIDSAQIENPMTSLASSASGIARYMGQQYKANLEQAKSTASILESQSKQSSWEAANAKQRADLESLQNRLEVNALQDLTSKMVKDSKGVWHSEFNPDSEYFKKYKDAMMEDQVIKARQGARNMYADILQGINSAKGVADTISHFFPFKPGPLSKGTLKNAKDWAEIIHNATH